MDNTLNKITCPYNSLFPDEVVSDDGSGDLDPVAEVNIEVKDTFRDLICFECSGGECPSRHYHEPLRHLVVSCQACYKEWDHGEWGRGYLREWCIYHLNSGGGGEI